MSDDSKTTVVGPPHPTAPDVDRLAAMAYVEGATITHAEIEEAIGEWRGSKRYQTVVGAWKRRMLRERNIVLAAVPGVGYEVLLPGQRVTAGASLREQAVRRARLGQRILRGTDTARLTPEERAVWDHEAKVGAAVIAVGRTSMRQVEASAKLAALAEKAG